MILVSTVFYLFIKLISKLRKLMILVSTVFYLFIKLISKLRKLMILFLDTLHQQGFDPISLIEILVQAGILP